jgi:ssDNA-binding Zn-finger/Zn-ribbon topoisomerase 1
VIDRERARTRLLVADYRRELRHLAGLRHQCPSCGGALEIRVASKGSNAGGEFWGCWRYPRCKYTAPLSRFERSEQT